MPSLGRRLVVAVGALLAFLGTLALGVGPAGAHASLQDTSPADDALVEDAPDQVTLRFDEPVSASTGAVQVVSPSGGRIEGPIDEADGGRALVIGIDGGARGTYTVAYRVVSDDGHTITGSFVFHVGVRTGAANVDQSIPIATSATGGVGRWLGYAGAAVAVGGALLLALLQRRAPQGDVAGARRIGALILGGAAARALGTAAAVGGQTASTTGRSPFAALSLVTEVASDSRPVAVALLRSGVLVAAALVGLAGWLRQRSGVLVGTGGVVALAGLLAPVAGHPWTADARALAVSADAVHLLAASIWLGMLVALVVAGPSLADPDRAVRAVSGAALAAAVVVLVSGSASAWLLLGYRDAITQTASGQLVVAKVVGFALLVVLGWINRTRLIPLLGRVAADGQPAPSAGAARRALLNVVRAEVVVGALVLAVTAGLVNQPPGRDVLAEPYEDVRTEGDLTMRLQVTPAQVGDNTMHIYLTDTDGRAVRFDALEATVAREGIPPRKLDGVTPVTPDHASIYGASLPTAGTWTVTLTTVTLTTTATFTFEVSVQ